nr:MAG TPA: 24-sterol C-methyltransferase [Caudoviricetes sp.]
MIKIICNNCGKELDAYDQRLALSIYERYADNKLFFGFNLCKKCRKKFITHIRRVCKLYKGE